MLNEKIDEITIEEKILETLQAILYRINKLEDKLDQLNDPYNLNDYFKAKNNELEENKVYYIRFPDNTSLEEVNSFTNDLSNLNLIDTKFIIGYGDFKIEDITDQLSTNEFDQMHQSRKDYQDGHFKTLSELTK